MPDAAPSVNNYYVGKGILKWKPIGGVFRDLGNAPQFEFTPNVSRLDHWTSREGTRAKDFSPIHERTATIRMILEETGDTENLAMYLLGNVTPAAGGDPFDTIDIFSNVNFLGSVRFIGRNDIGVKSQWDLPLVSLLPGAAIGLISDTWGSLELTGDVLIDPVNGFGQVRNGIVTEVDV
jgi:hypothetical protein